MSGVYKNAFWECDFLSQAGFDTLSSHMKEGQKSCKWLEDFLKQRAKAEEEYAKTLLKLSKTNTSDFGSLQATLKKLVAESEAEAVFHNDVAVKLQEQCQKLNEFRERQREDRKKYEDYAHRSHKTKADQYRRMINCKASYENKFRAAEKAESDADKLKFGTKPKEAEKAKSRAIQNRAVCMKADDDYKAAITSLEGSRVTWVNDYSVCCDEFQRMEEERIVVMRNMVWVFSNLVSDLCCRLDESRESIRLVAEKCSEGSDIQDFAAQKSTGTSPLSQIHYQPCGVNGTMAASASPLLSRSDILNHSLPPVPVPNGSHNSSPRSVYEMGDDPLTMVYLTASYNYSAQTPDEINLKEGDRLQRISTPANGWVKVLNMQTNKTGIVPLNHTKE